jgi:hypothetical protein
MLPDEWAVESRAWLNDGRSAATGAERRLRSGSGGSGGSCGDLLEKVAGAKLALEHGGHRGVDQPLDLAMERRREPQPEDANERRPLEVAHHLQRVRRHRAGALCGPALRAEGAATDGGVRISLRLQVRATLEATGQLRSEAHRVEQRKLEPAGNDLARHLVAGIERGESLGEEAEGVVGVGGALDEAVDELDQVPRGGGGVEVVAQAEVVTTSNVRPTASTSWTSLKGWSPPPIRDRGRRTPLAITRSLPSRGVSTVSTRSASPSSMVRSTIASVL